MAGEVDSSSLFFIFLLKLSRLTSYILEGEEFRTTLATNNSIMSWESSLSGNEANSLMLSGNKRNNFSKRLSPSSGGLRFLNKRHNASFTLGNFFETSNQQDMFLGVTTFRQSFLLSRNSISFSCSSSQYGTILICIGSSKKCLSEGA